MENRRGDDPGRREEDRRWLKMQEQIMNVVTTLRTNQQELAKIEIEMGKISDHVEDVDDHLRGVAGHDSMDTRVTVMEKDVYQHGVLLRQIAKHFGAIETLVSDIKMDISTFKIHRSIADKTEAGRTERFKEWLKFWGPIALASIALIIPLTKMVFDNWDKIARLTKSDQYRPDERLRKEIEADKKSARAVVVKKKLEAIEKTKKALE